MDFKTIKSYILCFVLLFVAVFFNVPDVSGKKKIRVSNDVFRVEVYYINPSVLSYASLDKNDVIHSSFLRDDSGYRYYRFETWDKDTIGTIVQLINGLSFCERWKEEMFDVRIVVRLTENKDKVTDILLTTIYNQSIFCNGRMYNPNKDFYSYIMSLWPIEFDYLKPLRDGKCDEVLFED